MNPHRTMGKPLLQRSERVFLRPTQVPAYQGTSGAHTVTSITAALKLSFCKNYSKVRL